MLKCPEVFGNVQVTQYVPMNSELSDFETHVNLALEGITTSANPQLVISLGSHGDIGEVCRDGKLRLKTQNFKSDPFHWRDECGTNPRLKNIAVRADP